MKNNNYEFGSFDKYGNLNGSYFLFISFFLFITFYIVSLYVLNFEKIQLNVNNFASFYFYYFKRTFLYIDSFQDFFNYLKNDYKYLLLSFVVVFLYIYNVLNKKNEQRKLSSYGLENYYLHKKIKNGVVYKVVPGERMDYDKFLKQFENLIQRNNKGSCEISRFDKTGIKVIYKNKIPAIKELRNVKIQDCMKKDKLFLGFAGGIETKKEPVYVDFNDLPHSFALFVTLPNF